MKTLTTQHQTIAIPASADPSSLAWRVYQIALAALSASTIGGLSPAEIEIRIEVRGSDALAEIVEAAACNAVRGCGITDEAVFDAMVDNDITVDMPPKKSRRVKLTFDESDLSPLDNMTGGGTSPPIDWARWEAYAMGKAAGNESEGGND